MRCSCTTLQDDSNAAVAWLCSGLVIHGRTCGAAADCFGAAGSWQAVVVGCLSAPDDIVCSEPFCLAPRLDLGHNAVGIACNAHGRGACVDSRKDKIYVGCSLRCHRHNGRQARALCVGLQARAAESARLVPNMGSHLVGQQTVCQFDTYVGSDIVEFLQRIQHMRHMQFSSTSGFKRQQKRYHALKTEIAVLVTQTRRP